MKRIEGSLTYYVDNKEYSLNMEDIIHLCDKDNNGDYYIDKILTEDNIELALKSEMKSRRLKGCLHDIKLYLNNGTSIAQAENFSEGYGNLKFSIHKL